MRAIPVLCSPLMASPHCSAFPRHGCTRRHAPGASHISLSASTDGFGARPSLHGLLPPNVVPVAGSGLLTRGLPATPCGAGAKGTDHGTNSTDWTPPMNRNPGRQQTRHNCRRRHMTWRQFADCAWPDAEWIMGEGRWASLAHCRGLTVILFDSLDDARAAQDAIDRRACGGGCQRRHEVVELVIPAARVVARPGTTVPSPVLAAGWAMSITILGNGDRATAVMVAAASLALPPAYGVVRSPHARGPFPGPSDDY